MESGAYEDLQSEDILLSAANDWILHCPAHTVALFPASATLSGTSVTADQACHWHYDKIKQAHSMAMNDGLPAFRMT